MVTVPIRMLASLSSLLHLISIQLYIFFDTKYVELIIELVFEVNPKSIVVTKATIPTGYTKSVCKKFNTKIIFFTGALLQN